MGDRGLDGRPLLGRRTLFICGLRCAGFLFVPRNL
jgi:hypothetical protein